MEILKHIVQIQKSGFVKPQVKVISSEDASDWKIDRISMKIICLEKNILIELEDGSENKIESNTYFDIFPNTFYRITTEDEKAKYLMAVKAA
jgi:predicted type IV restriction endonuclease